MCKGNHAASVKITTPLFKPGAELGPNQQRTFCTANPNQSQGFSKKALDTWENSRHNYNYIIDGRRMVARRRSDAKLDALRQRGTLNPRPERVTDELFRQVEFFDARDLLQVKYEMIRRVKVDGGSVTGASEAFGVSRPSFYAAQAAFAHRGLAGLLPRKRGPRSGHKLNPEVIRFLEEIRAADSTIAASKLVPMVKERFGVEVHPRTIERAVRRVEKKRP